jgi:FtsH-binding integral membrane protein
MVILIASYIVGWASLAAGAYFGKKNGKKKYYAYGTAAYAFSWVMLAAGGYLVGPQGIALVKKLFRLYLWQTLGIAALIVAAAAAYYLIHRHKIR